MFFQVSANHSPSMTCTFNLQSFKKIKSSPDHADSPSQTDQTHSSLAKISTSDQTSLFSTSTVSPLPTISTQCSSVVSSFDMKLERTLQVHVRRSSHQGVILPDLCLNPVSKKKEEKHCTQNQLDRMGDQGQNAFLCFCLKLQYHMKFTWADQVMSTMTAPGEKMGYLTTCEKKWQKKFTGNSPALLPETGR